MFQRITSLCLFLCLTGMLLLTLPVGGVENNGPEEMILHGGNRGDVSFNHRRHQEKVGDCHTCHSLFPKVRDGIQTQIAEGKLAGKQVMNKLCVKCHREKREAGAPSGPVSCNTCHNHD